MKKTRIVVVASKPVDGQDGITHLIGNEYDAEVDEKDRALIHCAEFGGQIILGPSEWREKGEGEPA